MIYVHIPKENKLQITIPPHHVSILQQITNPIRTFKQYVPVTATKLISHPTYNDVVYVYTKG